MAERRRVLFRRFCAVLRSFPPSGRQSISRLPRGLYRVVGTRGVVGDRPVRATNLAAPHSRLPAHLPDAAFFAATGHGRGLLDLGLFLTISHGFHGAMCRPTHAVCHA